MSDLPNLSNGFVATIDYDLSLVNLNAIFGGMWDALQPYRDVVAEADAAIAALNARTLTVIGESIGPELDQARADVVQARADIDALVVQATDDVAALVSDGQSEIDTLVSNAEQQIDALVDRWQVVAAPTTALPGQRLFVDASGGAFTVTLPASPSAGDEVWFADPGADWGTNSPTVDGNGNNIDGAATFAADVNEGAFIAVYDGSAWAVRFATGVA